jgi:hypothetical protein
MIKDQVLRTILYSTFQRFEQPGSLGSGCAVAGWYALLERKTTKTYLASQWRYGNSTNDYSDFNWYSPDKSTRKQKHDELLQFTLDTDSHIRQLRSDRFDTVQIGTRYDCGISPGFYVIELTRFANADTFSGLLAPSHDQIIGPLARMIAEKLLI